VRNTAWLTWPCGSRSPKRTISGTRKGKSSSFVYRDSVWHGCDLLGTGVSSFSHLSGVHFQNVTQWGEYLATVGEGRLPLGRGLAITDRERLTREMILQLKLGTLPVPYFGEKFGADVLAEFAPAWRRPRRDLALVADDI